MYFVVFKGFGFDKDVGYFFDIFINFNCIVFDCFNNLFFVFNGVKVGENGREENMNLYINGVVGGVG